MTQFEAKEILVRCFSCATKREKANWKYHLDKGTKILCGENTHLYTDGKGAG